MSDPTPTPAGPAPTSRDNAAHRFPDRLIQLSTPCPRCGQEISGLFLPLPSDAYIPCPRCGHTCALTINTRRTSVGTMISLDQVVPRSPSPDRRGICPEPRRRVR
jgi:hypothetical protein